jgi:DNA processing protein
MGGAWLHLDAPDYPPLLAASDDAPPVLAVLGDPALLLRRQVAVVGARNASATGCGSRRNSRRGCRRRA